MPNDAPDFGLATAGQLRRAGFEIAPPSMDDSATTGFDILTNHSDDTSAKEFEKAATRGDHLPKGKKA